MPPTVDATFTSLGTPNTRRKKFAAKYNVPSTVTPRGKRKFDDLLRTAHRLFNPYNHLQPDLKITANMVEAAIREPAKKETAPGTTKISDADHLRGGKAMFEKLAEMYNEALANCVLLEGMGDSHGRFHSCTKEARRVYVELETGRVTRSRMERTCGSYRKL
uniref:Uncharacterized protein n=1 Tax=Branchiostoma floridae TaxID=7739 RepID=C3Y9R2_BRAFL|eukprot:XP_002607308.1 hypothetical protein BRAFLDRAFT_100662 [Branchiostoma floridae]